jgi:hypothetical protein
MVIHTHALKDYIEVVKWAFDQGIMWCSGSDSINESFWYKNESKTCVVINFLDQDLTYCHLEYAYNRYNKNDIISMSEFYQRNRKLYIKKFGLK